MAGHVRSGTQSSLCSELHSPPSGHFGGFPSEEPPWMTLYGNLEAELASSRNAPTLAEGPLRRKPHLQQRQQQQRQDLAQSYQSAGNSFRPRDSIPHPSRVGTEVWSAAVAPVGRSASSWQPACENAGRLVRRSTGKKSSVRVKSTAAAIMGAAFRTFPFGIHPQIFGLKKTVSQRRWAHFHTAGKNILHHISILSEV